MVGTIKWIIDNDKIVSGKIKSIQLTEEKTIFNIRGQHYECFFETEREAIRYSLLSKRKIIQKRLQEISAELHAQQILINNFNKENDKQDRRNYERD